MAFRTLPLEVNEHIATFIDDDKDLCNFLLICTDTYNAVHSHRQSVWKAQFSKQFDLGPGKAGKKVVVSYMTRRMVLRRGAREGFRKGETKLEKNCFNILRELIIESFADASKTSKGMSKNLAQLYRFVLSSNFLDTMLINVHKSEEDKRLMQTIQVALTHLQLNLQIKSKSIGFALSQQMMYCLPNKAPLFQDKKGTVNIEFLLHIVNFFKNHMTCETENTLYPLLCDLAKHERPSAWTGPIKNDGLPKLPGQQWRGSYAYIPETGDLQTIRARDSLAACQDDPIPDAIDYDEGFQTLALDPVPSLLKWPTAFEDHLHAIPPAPILGQLGTENSPELTSTRRSTRGSHRTRRVHAGFTYDNLLPETGQAMSSSSKGPSPKHRERSPAKLGKDYVVFTGRGRDLGPYQCSGVVHNLPPQSGIPGWRRLCMMKYTADPSPSSSQSSSTTVSSPDSSPSAYSSTSSSSSISSLSSTTSSTNGADPFQWDHHSSQDDPVYVDDDCWCYEGIVLPGGKIILGRWWHPLEDNADLQSVGPFIFWNTDQ